MCSVVKNYKLKLKAQQGKEKENKEQKNATVFLSKGFSFQGTE